VIDLRSDTLTKPTPAMLAAMAAAEVGDEQYGEDPTVLELQRRAADLLGEEAAVFLPTATMANEIALSLLGQPGGELIAEERTHVLVFESGGPAFHARLVAKPLRVPFGRVTPEQVREVVAESDWLQPPSVLVLENTHRSSGGRVWPLQELEATVAAARELGLAAHLDGARLLNASVASGVPAASYGRPFDSVTLCFSKGLGCPLGAVLAGSEELMRRAFRYKFLFGGALRQAGIVAAAMLHALDHHVERLADDHTRAARLGQALAAAGLPAVAETNFVSIELEPLGLTAAEACFRAEQAGVLVSPLRPGVLRAVTYLGVDDDDAERAAELLPRALGALARA
jgi:threonine aldolase